MCETVNTFNSLERNVESSIYRQISERCTTGCCGQRVCNFVVENFCIHVTNIGDLERGWHDTLTENVHLISDGINVAGSESLSECKGCLFSSTFKCE